MELEPTPTDQSLTRNNRPPAKLPLLDQAKRPMLNVHFEKARTKTTNTRRWALREAERLVTADLKNRLPPEQLANFKVTTSTSMLDKQPRTVNVNDQVAFQQDHNRLRGDFLGEFSHLQLPP